MLVEHHLHGLTSASRVGSHTSAVSASNSGQSRIGGDTFKGSTIGGWSGGRTGGSRNVGKMSIGDAGPEGYSTYVIAIMHMKEMRPAEEKKFSVDALTLESFIRQFEENVECLPALRPEVVFKQFMVWLKGSPLKVRKFLRQYDDPKLALAEAKNILRQQFGPNAAGFSDVIDRLTKALTIPRKDANLLREFIADLRSTYLHAVCAGS
jgi:hypothetical protein